MKILLVEDHPGSRRNLQRLIAKRGHDVTAVSSAEEAEAELAAQSFPFLILDWMLPEKAASIFAANCGRALTATRCLSSWSRRKPTRKTWSRRWKQAPTIISPNRSTSAC